MPSLSVHMLRLSLLWLILAFASGSLLLLNKAFGLHPSLWALLPLHMEMALFGWILQFVLGTAYWMFPRFLDRPRRGGVRPARFMVLTLNLAIPLSALSFLNPILPTLSRLFLLLSVLLFFRLIWGRVVSYRDL